MSMISKQRLAAMAKKLKDSGLKSTPQRLDIMLCEGAFPLFHSLKDFLAAEKKDGNAECRNNSFDLMTFRDYSITTVADDLGNTKELQCNERYYVPCEITWLLKSLGFQAIDIFGAKLGAFSRADKLTADDFEMLVIAKK